MGDKVESKAFAHQANVNTIPGKKGIRWQDIGLLPLVVLLLLPSLRTTQRMLMVRATAAAMQAGSGLWRAQTMQCRLRGRSPSLS